MTTPIDTKSNTAELRLHADNCELAGVNPAITVDQLRALIDAADRDAAGNLYHDECRLKPAQTDTLPPIIHRIRAIARRLGWAVGVHGSLVRDIDLIATPWTKEAVPWREFHAALIAEVPLNDAEGNLLGVHRGPFGRIKVLALQPGCVRDGDHPKGKWLPPCIDLSIIDPREVLSWTVTMPMAHRLIHFSGHGYDDYLRKSDVIAALKAAGVTVKP